MKAEQPKPKYRYEIVSVEFVECPISYDEYAVRLARVAEALYSMLTSSASSKNPVEVIDGLHASSLHLHETLNAGTPACPRDMEVDIGKDEPETAA